MHVLRPNIASSYTGDMIDVDAVRSAIQVNGNPRISLREQHDIRATCVGGRCNRRYLRLTRLLGLATRCLVNKDWWVWHVPRLSLIRKTSLRGEALSFA